MAVWLHLLGKNSLLEFKTVKKVSEVFIWLIRVSEVFNEYCKKSKKSER